MRKSYKSTLLTGLTMVAVQSQTYTLEEFLGLDLPEGQEYELVNGIITPIAEPLGLG